VARGGNMGSVEKIAKIAIFSREQFFQENDFFKKIAEKIDRFFGDFFEKIGKNS
jgi:hypothetical protein